MVNKWVIITMSLTRKEINEFLFLISKINYVDVGDGYRRQLMLGNSDVDDIVMLVTL